MATFRVTAKFAGTKALAQRLALLAKRVRQKVLTAAGKAGAKIVIQAARRLVPRLTRLLMKSLGSRAKVYRNGNVIVVAVGPRSGYRRMKVGGKGGVMTRTLTKFARVTTRGGRRVILRATQYAHLVEGGARPHAVGKGSSLRRRQGGKLHPGAHAHPFLRTAAEDNAAAVQEEVRRVVEAGLAREASR